MLNDFPHMKRLRHRIDTGLTDAETMFNSVTDSERQWWPFAFLRPQPDAHFSTLRVAMLAALQGLPLGLLLVAIDGHARRAANEQRLLTFLFIVCATVFMTNGVHDEPLHAGLLLEPSSSAARFTACTARDLEDR